MRRTAADVNEFRKAGKPLHEIREVAEDVPPPPGQAPAAASLTMPELLERELHRIEQGIPVVPTGFQRFDAAIGGGLQVPSLNVCGAGPKSGKSTWAQIVAARHAEHGGAVFYLDLENGATRFLRRLLCRRSGLGPREVTAALKDPNAAVFKSRDALQRWRDAQAWAATLPIRVAFTAPADLEAELRLAKRQAPGRDLLAVFDSLQKLPGNLEERRATVDGWLRQLEQLRDPLRAVFLVISEIRRGKEGYAPREDAFKESGSVEYSADLAFTMSRAAADEDGDDVSTLRIEVARDCEEDPRGDVASYRPVRPHYDLEEIDPVERKARKGGGKADAAQAWLAELLTGRALRVREVLDQGDAAGFSRATVYRAREALGDVVDCLVDLKKGWRRA